MRRAAVLGALAVCVAALVVIMTSGGSDQYQLRAVFTDANGIRANYWVRVNGAVAGTITGVDVTPQGQALLTMELDRGVAPVGAGASAEIRPTDLLGENYVQLHRGDLHHPLPSGATIPVQRTQTPVSLDQVLNMLAPTTRTKLRILINEAGIAMAGRGANFNALLQQLPNALSGARSVVTQLAAENAQLGQLIDQADLAVGPLDQRRYEVNQLVLQADRALGAVADRRAQLAATVRSAPAALTQITRSLDRLDVAAQRLQPAAALLDRTAPALTNTLQQLPSLAASLRSPLTTATQVAPQLTRLGSSGTPAIRRLTPTVALLATVLGEARPLVYTLGRAGGADGVLGILSNWAKAASYQDGVSHYFDFHVSISQQVLTDAVQRVLASGAVKTGARTHSTTHSLIQPVPATPRSAPGSAPRSTTPAPGRTSGSPAATAPTRTAPTGVPAAAGVVNGLSSLLKYLIGR